jgi:PEP-CTERM motif
MTVRAVFLATLLASATVVLLSEDPASATLLTFPTRVAFAAGVPGATVETWDDDAAGTVIPDGTSLDGITYTTPGPDALVTDAFQALSGLNTLGDVADGFFAPPESVTFSFPSPILAFGISINTFDTGAGGYTATTNLGEVAPSGFDPFSPPGVPTGQFVGFLADLPFSAVTLAAPGGFSYTLDDLTFVPGTPTGVPEPATLILVGSGLAGLGALAWRRNRR